MELYFKFGNEIVIVKIEGTNVLFANQMTNFQQYFPIAALKLNKEGILKEHPDLKDLGDEEIKSKGIERFKEHIKTLGNENRIKDYIVKELTNCGYVLQGFKKGGFRYVKA